MKDQKKKKSKIKLGVYFTLIVVVEILLISGASVLISYIYSMFFGEAPVLPEYVWILLFSALIGAACSVFVNIFVLSRISELSKNMSRVAQGEFNIELQTSSKIDEIQELYDSFNLMTRELSATEILQTDFVSNVSHEFKTPINAIEGYATLLQDSRLSEEEKNEYIEKIIFNTQRLSTLVGNILLISRLDNQAIESCREKYRMDEQIRQVLLTFEERWSKKDISLDVDLEDVDFFGNESLTFHVFGNIIGNAIKFSPDKGEISIRLLRRDKNIIFTVEDSGEGISEKDINHIFDKFYQSDSSHKAEGNGLGLSLVKSILDLMGGEICAENRECGGARFTVVIPER